MRKLKSNQKKSLATNARPGSVYDKVIKENFDKSLRTIIQDIGGFRIVQSKPLPTKMQHTKERDPDELCFVRLTDGTEKMLHVEAHLKDEEDVNFRMCEYHIMIKRLYKKLPLIQYVIYIGNDDPTHIVGKWATESIQFQYNVIVLKNIPYHVFLNAENPETVVFSILANFQGESAEIIGEKITTRLKQLAKTTSAREKYFTQLRVLSNIRKLQPIIEKIMENIFKLIDISEDTLYAKGKQEGKLEGKLEGKYEGKIEAVESLIVNTDFNDEHIAFLMAVPVQLVVDIRERLRNRTV
ncbi:MAG: hypothetical protein JNL70_03625 [Saprospiraceae bacterium]|nr:hypothetical protein [Saprospiraceae bacterium]